MTSSRSLIAYLCLSLLAISYAAMSLMEIVSRYARGANFQTFALSFLAAINVYFLITRSLKTSINREYSRVVLFKLALSFVVCICLLPMLPYLVMGIADAAKAPMIRTGTELFLKYPIDICVISHLIFLRTLFLLPH